MEPTKEICLKLKDRLQDAEAKTKAALSQTEAGHPLIAPTQELLAIHTEIRDLLLANFEEESGTSRIEDDPKLASEAIQIEREAHTMKPEFMDVVKALFMWKDDPVKRVEDN